MRDNQRVLIVGGGGREHALAWKIAQSPRLGKLFVAPGNGGTLGLAENVPISASDIPKLVDFAKSKTIDLVVVAPDDALAAGAVDAFNLAGIRAFGPTQAAAKIESSKAFAKELMARAGVPTAGHQTFTDLLEAKKYIQNKPLPLVIKASGLALGKGVVIAETYAEANHALEDMMSEHIFGDAGSEVVIEEFLTGQEVSVHAFCDGETAILFPSAQDHKRIGTGDKGPNTGGMGTYAPVPWFTDEMLRRISRDVIEPILRALSEAGTPFKGLLYPGLMVAPDGSVKVLEFNARFGDPETQSYVRLLESDLLDVIEACVDGTLDKTKVSWSDRSAVTVVLASEGYPGKSHTGRVIDGINQHIPDGLHFGDWRAMIEVLPATGKAGK